MKDELIALILQTVQDMNPDAAPANGAWNGDTPLFGPEGILDSMGLVSTVIAIEQAIEDQYNVSVALADDKALSQKNSPFRTVNTLADYAVQELQPQL
jgi:hypothetical protein